MWAECISWFPNNRIINTLVPTIIKIDQYRYLSYCTRDGRLWKYESTIIVCASITIIAIIGYLTYVCRFHSTIKLIPFICWVKCWKTDLDVIVLKTWSYGTIIIIFVTTIWTIWLSQEILIMIITIIKILPIPILYTRQWYWIGSDIWNTQCIRECVQAILCKVWLHVRLLYTCTCIHSFYLYSTLIKLWLILDPAV